MNEDKIIQAVQAVHDAESLLHQWLKDRPEDEGWRDRFIERVSVVQDLLQAVERSQAFQSLDEYASEYGEES